MSKLDDHRKNIYFPDIEIIKHAEKMADKNNVSFGYVMTQAYAAQHGLKFDESKYRIKSKKIQTADMKINRGGKFEVKA